MVNIKMLSDIETKEVSLVKRGANKKRFALTKSEKTNMQEILEAVLNTEAENEKEVIELFKTAGAVDKGLEASTGLYRLLTSFKDELQGEVVESVLKSAGFEVKKEEPVKKTEKKVDLNGLDPEVRELIQKSEKANKEAIEKAEKLEKQLAEERDLRIVKEWTEKSDMLFSHIPAKSSELATLFKSFDGETASKVETILKDANELIKNSEVLINKGKTYELKHGGAWDEIVAKANEIVQKSSEPVGQAKAIDMFLATPEGKVLYEQYLNENQAQTGKRG